MGVLRRYLPILGWLPALRPRAGSRADAVAGLSVWALLVPQSLAYATLAGVPVQYGLYTAFAALLAYPLFGTSRQLVAGAERGRVRRLGGRRRAARRRRRRSAPTRRSGTRPRSRSPTGAVYVALGLLRMGWVSTFLSKAVHVRLRPRVRDRHRDRPVHSLLGVAGRRRLVRRGALGHDRGRSRHAASTTLAVGAASLALLLVMRYRLPRWPRVLIVVALAIVAVERARPRRPRRRGHRGRADGPVLGRPARRGWSETTALLVGALSIVFVGYSESLAAAAVDGAQARLRDRHRPGADRPGHGVRRRRPRRRLRRSTAACRRRRWPTPPASRSQMASLINAAFILLTMLFLAACSSTLPGATLGAVVIDAMIGLITLREFKRYYRGQPRRLGVLHGGRRSGSCSSGSSRGS